MRDSQKFDKDRKNPISKATVDLKTELIRVVHRDVKIPKRQKSHMRTQQWFSSRRGDIEEVLPSRHHLMAAPQSSAFHRKEKGIHRDRYLCHFSLNFRRAPRPGVPDTFKMACGSSAVQLFCVDPALTTAGNRPGVYRTKLLKSPETRLRRPGPGAG